MGRKYLNNRMRILLHLSKYSSFIDEFNAPVELTQEGISNSIGVGRNNVPRELKKLMNEDLIHVKKCHVRGVRNKRSVYILTRKGMSEANKIKDELKELPVTVIDFSGNRETHPLKDIPKNYGIDFVTAAINLDKNRNLDLVGILRRREKAFHSIDENLIVREFYGRKEELEEMEKWAKSNKKILILSGISGIGKTTLLLKFVKERLKDRNVLFIKIENWKSADGIIHQIAGFFSRIGIPKIEKYLRSVALSEERNLNWNNILLLIKESLRDEIFIFDNVENADTETKKLIRKIIDLVNSKNNFKVILSGTEIGDIVPPSKLGWVKELKIVELKEEDALDMLRQYGVPEDKALKIISTVGGNPLLLHLAKDQNYPMMRRFIFEGILKTLNKEEREALEFISVFRKNFKMDVLLLNNFEYFVIYSLINKNILLEMEYENFTVHRIIKNFVYEHLTEEKRKKYHLMAARYYEENGDILEAVYHYTHAEKLMRANILLSENYEKYLFTNGNEIRNLALEILNRYDKDVDDYEWKLYGIIGDTYYISGKWEEALDNYKKARFLFKGKDLDFYAKIVVSISEVLGKMGKYAEAIKTLNEVLKNINGIRDESIISRAYYILGIMSMKIGEEEDAKDYLLEAIKIAEKSSDLKSMGYAYNGLGIMKRYEGNYEDAISYFKKAREYFELYGDLLGLVKAIINIGSVYYDIYDDRAERYYREALRISQKIGEKWGIGISYLSMANWSMYKERYFDAKEYLEKSEKIFEELDAPGELVYVYNSFGIFYAYLGDKERGKEYFDKGINLAARIGNEKAIINISKSAAEYLRKYGYAYVEEYEKIAKGKKKVVAIINI